ncbi:MAG: hypothetical protein NTV23_14825 [Propionibacteriales bacterium]|nr:hypothetical protein [Propionibacteriales bacterium]
MKRLVPAACALAFLLPGPAGAEPASEPVPDRPAPPRNCRVLAHQPAAKPVTGPRGHAMTIVVVVPATTCNTR